MKNREAKMKDLWNFSMEVHCKRFKISKSEVPEANESNSIEIIHSIEFDLKENQLLYFLFGFLLRNIKQLVAFVQFHLTIRDDELIASFYQHHQCALRNVHIH